MSDQEMTGSEQMDLAYSRLTYFKESLLLCLENDVITMDAYNAIDDMGDPEIAVLYAFCVNFSDIEGAK